MAPYLFLIEVCLAKILFQNLISIKSYRGKSFGRPARPPSLDQKGLIAKISLKKRD